MASVLSVETVEMLVERLSNIESALDKKMNFNVKNEIVNAGICPCWIQELKISTTGEVYLRCFAIPKKECKNCNKT